ncbi:hypothetical protein LIER_00443 [Lithospermum erythrorhizon]|uniref:C2H2-type domain-containing protein n=1 Tax=Lithospermum erythrorhizon TaxID=34254 RepID=A0AAV3NIH5_LITER
MLDNSAAASSNGPSSSSDAFTSSENGILSNKRKRKPAGTPDPDAEVVSLSPQTLLESDRYVCEICSQGFQRDQNLQMHRRRHKVPWKLLKKDESTQVKKRVYVCPEPSCLHHDPRHALGDLVGIKKHFRRKHSTNKQWVCEKCSKGYAVQSDYKAHIKTCGTRGHSCDCGRVFSRVESFIEHQDSCTARVHIHPDLQSSQFQAIGCSSHPSTTLTNFSTVISLPRLQMFPQLPRTPLPPQIPGLNCNSLTTEEGRHNVELQLLPSSSIANLSRTSTNDDNHQPHLKLSIGSCTSQENNEICESTSSLMSDDSRMVVKEELKMAMAEKAFAEEARRQAKKQLELAELDFGNAKRIRQQAQVELQKAQVFKDEATKKISATILEITCNACKQQFQKPVEETSLATSHISSDTIDVEGVTN